MNTEDITLITVIANVILQPIIQYMLHSRCTHIECCCLKCDRSIMKAGSNSHDDLENAQEK